MNGSQESCYMKLLLARSGAALFQLNLFKGCTAVP